ncbi:hypothetical protein FHS42_005569 [Streptomyces zagrosensis]|uniref:Uncharacterized protein n=1 Tax=Streptomyces zagrosensis TaxID=1042984 RepID=A0A7W9QDZ5_9ACTN|nr:hypothetical protein [Streptomyces zagrosensis]
MAELATARDEARRELLWLRSDAGDRARSNLAA